MLKKVVTTVIALLAAVVLFPLAAPSVQAAQRAVVQHDIGSGNIRCTDNTKLYRITGASKKYWIVIDGGTAAEPIMVDLAGVDIDFTGQEDTPFEVKSGAHAIIYIGKDDPGALNTLKGGSKSGLFVDDVGYAGLCIHNGAQVTIAGQGRLTAHGGEAGNIGGAGIGGNSDKTVSDLVFDGTMTIAARGGHGAPGIGGGRDGELHNLTIKNGHITAAGGKYAPGIGTGDKVGSGSGGSVHGISISGGTVVANGGYHAAGIGGSEGGLVERISITGGTITATGGENGAGIGSEGGNCKHITISGGTVTATGGKNGAGIGGGHDSTTSNITISGGAITAKGGAYAAGIGSANGDCKGITISGGDITATGGEQGAGIGSGKDAFMQNILVSGGTIIATGGENAAGIGGGDNVNTGNGGNVDGLVITGGAITAKGGKHGAGIGGSDDGEVSGLKIDQKTSLTITATGGEWAAGIGSARRKPGNIAITLRGGEIDAQGGKRGAGIGGGESETNDIHIEGTGRINARGGGQACGIGAGGAHHTGAIKIIGTGARDALRVYANAQSGVGMGSNKMAGIGSGNDKSGNITLKNATITAYADDYGAAIGTGQLEGAFGGIALISISQCDVVTGGSSKWCADIGAGYGSRVDRIEIIDSTVDGGSIGGSAFSTGSDFLHQNRVLSISIKNSDVTAIADGGEHNQCAGIGSGVWGSMESIEITGSTVKAQGANGGAGIGSGGFGSSGIIGDYLRTDGKLGTLTITNSTVTATGQHGGAGLGGGSRTTAEKITITDSTVHANGSFPAEHSGGAGIGGGYIGSADSITIAGGTVVATGGPHSAGIGSSGDTDLSTLLWQVAVGDITIKDGADVTAQGGSGGAGIGAGSGARTHGDINISDSTVNATGGENGAGIGGGKNGAAGYGGDLENLTITGNSKVTAQGGKHGAGIGGGLDGAARNLTFRLTNAPTREYFVNATGGTGAAGIGSGAVHYEAGGVGLATGHDASSIAIEGGSIIAQGGGKLVADGHTLGSGAGIGGGCHAGKLQGFSVSGGFVQATRGGGDAMDIGHGGQETLTRIERDRSFNISGGTIVSTHWSDEAGIVISGGSVAARLAGVENAAGDKVYRTTLTLADEALALLEPFTASVAGYGTKSIFSDADKKVYLYYPATTGKRSAATFKVPGGTETRHYYGQTTSDGNGVMKMDGILAFKTPAEKPVLGGSPFALWLDDAGLSGWNYTFTATGALSLNTVLRGHSPGGGADFLAGDFGPYTVTATAEKPDDPVYWSCTAVTSGRVTTAQGAIEIVENPSKVYDGQPAEAPTVRKNSAGAVTITYYSGSTPLAGPPTDTGSYTVVAEMAASAPYTGATSAPQALEIHPRRVVLGLAATGTHTSLVVKATVANMLAPSGSVRFEFDGHDGSVEAPITETNGVFTATYTFTSVPANDYTVVATYLPGPNYVCDAPARLDLTKNLALREIEIDPVFTKSYLDAGFTLAPTTQNTGSNDAYAFEVAFDHHAAVEDAVTVEAATGAVTIQNAGMATIKITLRDLAPSPLYNPAVAYVQVWVTRVPLHVASVAEAGGTAVSQVEYGQTAGLAYTLAYAGTDFKPGDTPDNFTGGWGRLYAISPAETQAVTAPGAGCEILIGRQGVDMTVSGYTFENIFFSRNYELIDDPGRLAVTPAPLAVQPQAAEGACQTEPEYRYTLEGAMPWDDAADIFDPAPQAGLDTTQTGGKPYAQLAPGVYPDAVGITQRGTPRLNSNGVQNYAITYGTAHLTVQKLDPALQLVASSKIYDGQPVRAQLEMAEGYDGATPEIVYYKITATADAEGLAQAANRQRLPGPPADAGLYVAEVRVAEAAHYIAAQDMQPFVILKASPKPDIPRLPDMAYHGGLALGAQPLPAGWAWVNPQRTLAPGPVRALGQYTPEDTQNYRVITCVLGFAVTQGLPDSSDSSDSSSSDSSSKPGKPDDPSAPGDSSDTGATVTTPAPPTGDAGGTRYYAILAGCALAAGLWVWRRRRPRQWLGQ